MTTTTSTPVYVSVSCIKNSVLKDLGYGDYKTVSAFCTQYMAFMETTLQLLEPTFKLADRATFKYGRAFNKGAVEMPCRFLDILMGVIDIEDVAERNISIMLAASFLADFWETLVRVNKACS